MALGFGTGCASTGKSVVREPMNVKFGQFKSATVEVSSTMEKPPEKLNEFMAQLESRIIAKLREEKSFERIYPAAATDSPSELRLVLMITGVRDIDNFNRVMWGAFAGQANTRAKFEVRKKETDQLLGSVDIEGKSSGGSVFAGTTTQAVDRVADEVVRIVREHM